MGVDICVCVCVRVSVGVPRGLIASVGCRPTYRARAAALIHTQLGNESGDCIALPRNIC
jgi:hypothetical protein